jgi:hypothetical protein
LEWVLLFPSSGRENMEIFLLCWILDSYVNDYERYFCDVMMKFTCILQEHMLSSAGSESKCANNLEERIHLKKEEFSYFYSFRFLVELPWMGV